MPIKILAYNLPHQLSPFLKIGFIWEYFNHVGKTPRLSDLLHIYINGNRINDKLIFRICCGISSYSYEYLNFNDFTISLISLLVMGVVYIWERMFEYIREKFEGFMPISTYASFHLWQWRCKIIINKICNNLCIVT
jgi:hypothetical protein